MTRKDRKRTAELRRLEWRKRWSDLAREQLVAGKKFEQSVRVVALDMEKMATTQPQLRSEIIRAGNEFLDALAGAVARAAAKL